MLLYPAKGNTAICDLGAYILNQDVHYQVSDDCKRAQCFLPRCLCTSHAVFSGA